LNLINPLAQKFLNDVDTFRIELLAELVNLGSRID